jgi:hypothetical protein
MASLTCGRLCFQQADNNMWTVIVHEVNQPLLRLSSTSSQNDRHWNALMVFNIKVNDQKHDGSREWQTQVSIPPTGQRAERLSPAA